MRRLALRIRFFLGQKWQETSEGWLVGGKILLVGSLIFGLLIGLGELAGGWQWLQKFAGPDSPINQPGHSRLMHDLHAGMYLVIACFGAVIAVLVVAVLGYGIFLLVTQGIPSLRRWLGSNWRRAGERADEVLSREYAKVHGPPMTLRFRSDVANKAAVPKSEPTPDVSRWRRLLHRLGRHTWRTLKVSRPLEKRGVIGLRECQVCGRQQIRKAYYKGWEFNGHDPQTEKPTGDAT